MSPVDYLHANQDLLPRNYKWGHLFRRVYLGTYYPSFKDLVVEARAKAAERGHEYVSEYGFRSMNLQAAMRRAYLAGKGGKAAPAGLSAHQYGLADDVTADADTKTPGLQPTWDPAAYDVYGEELARVGLVWGASFADRPHANWPGFVSGLQLQPLLKIWNECPKDATDGARLPVIWQYLDALQGK